MVVRIRTHSKDRELVNLRRKQIACRAAQQFVKKGYRLVNLRQLASVCGMSVGNLYNYVGTKRDILYLVFDYVMSEVAEFVEAICPTYDALPATRALEMAIDTYYRMVDRLQDSVVFMYQEAKDLHPDARKAVSEMERRLGDAFEHILDRGYASGDFEIRGSPTIAQNIVILGQMWAFRRWVLRKYYAYVLEDYVKEQTSFIFRALRQGKRPRPVIVNRGKISRDLTRTRPSNEGMLNEARRVKSRYVSRKVTSRSEDGI